MLPMREICPETARKDRAPKGACPQDSGAGQHGVPPILMTQMGYQPGAWALAELHGLFQTAGSDGLAQRIHIRVLRLKPSQSPTGIGDLRGGARSIPLDQGWIRLPISWRCGGKAMRQESAPRRMARTSPAWEAPSRATTASMAGVAAT